MASPLPREKLFPWYTDFSDHDVDLSRKFSDGSLLARQVRRTDDNHVICEQRMKIGRMEIPAQYRITIHPENFTYDAEMDLGNLASEKRLYEFRDSGGGTMLRVKVDYTPKAGFVKFLNAIGLYKWFGRRSSRKTMAGYFRAAEAELKA